MKNVFFNSSYRWLTITVMLMLLVLTLTACSSSENSVKVTRIDTVADSQESVKTINMQGHWKGEDLREDFVIETVKEFEARNPNVKVNLKWNADFPGGRKGAIDATVNELKSGQTDWDVIWLEPFYYQEIANVLNDSNWGKTYLVDFETLQGFSESQNSFILSDPQFRNHMNGIITGPYIEGFYQQI
jgi:ABC-type glycerol-3-phosphate transport system substrate-binding protein